MQFGCGDKIMSIQMVFVIPRLCDVIEGIVYITIIIRFNPHQTLRWLILITLNTYFLLI